MTIKLLDLKKFAIDNRAAITYKESQTGRTGKVNAKGIVEVLANKEELIGFNAEQVLENADEFVIETGGKQVSNEPRQVMTRAQFAELLSQQTQAKTGHAEEKE